MSSDHRNFGLGGICECPGDVGTKCVEVEDGLAPIPTDVLAPAPDDGAILTFPEDGLAGSYSLHCSFSRSSSSCGRGLDA